MQFLNSHLYIVFKYTIHNNIGLRQQLNRILELQFCRLVLARHPNIFSGPVWQPLSKISWNANFVTIHVSVTDEHKHVSMDLDNVSPPTAIKLHALSTISIYWLVKKVSPYFTVFSRKYVEANSIRFGFLWTLKRVLNENKGLMKIIIIIQRKSSQNQKLNLICNTPLAHQ